MAAHVFRIKMGGDTRVIYSDEIKCVLDKNKTTIRRASDVEPGDPDKGQDQNLWYADMSRSNGPVLPGAESREIALQREVSWLLTNHLPASAVAPVAGLGSRFASTASPLRS
jgi:hypothetical protein